MSGRRFTLPWADVASNAVQNTYETMAALIAANTAGHRCRLRSLFVGPADDAPVDLQVALKLSRVDAVSGGGAGTAASNPEPQPKDSLQLAAVITTGIDYSTGGVEPTVYNTVALWQGSINGRGAVNKEWSEADAPVINRDQLLGLLVAPRTAAAVRLDGCLEFEEF